MHTSHRIAVALAMAFLLQGGRVAWAGGCHEVQCPRCKHICKLSVDKEEVDKYCWKIKVEPICIPRIKWPWEPCCAPPKCAKVKYIHVLEKHEYECEKCKYEWTPELIPCRCHGGGGACTGIGCAPSYGAAPMEGGSVTPRVDAQGAPPTVPDAPDTETAPPVPADDPIPQPPPIDSRKAPATSGARPVSFEQPEGAFRKVLPVFFKPARGTR